MQNHKWLWLLAALLAWLFGGGCMASLPVEKFIEMMDKPAFQATLKEYAQRSDVTNPNVGVYWVTGVEIRVNGVIVRGETTGSADSPGVDPVKLKALIAATQPSN